MSDKSETRAGASAAMTAYEPPQLVVIGPVTKFTFGSTGAQGDRLGGKFS